VRFIGLLAYAVIVFPNRRAWN